MLSGWHGTGCGERRRGTQRSYLSSTKLGQSLPRELGLREEGTLRIRPLRELEGLREEPQTRSEVELKEATWHLLHNQAPKGTPVASLLGESAELR